MARASLEERESRLRLRAELWRGVLSVEQYCERTRRLYEHPFGQTRIETLVLKNESAQILTSMDVLHVGLLLKRGGGEPVEERGTLIASVLTSVSERNKGHATRLLTEYFQANPHASGVLYSDIGPPFYERFGFAAWPTRCRRGPRGESGSAGRSAHRDGLRGVY